jgi:hypothetical protein
MCGVVLIYIIKKIIVLGGCSVLLDKRGVLCPDSNLQGGVAKLICPFFICGVLTLR